MEVGKVSPWGAEDVRHPATYPAKAKDQYGFSIRSGILGQKAGRCIRLLCHGKIQEERRNIGRQRKKRWVMREKKKIERAGRNDAGQ